MHTANVRDDYKVETEYKIDESNFFLIIQSNFLKSSPGKHENHSKNHHSVSFTNTYHSV